MRQPARSKGRRTQVSRTASIPSPTGGWNTRDNLASMPAKDAVTLDNWFPLPAEVMLRRGSQSHVTGLDGQVETLMGYQSATASKLFAVCDIDETAEIRDVTTEDTDGTPAAAVVEGLNSARMQYVNISTSGGSFLLAVNGVDKLQIYDGSAWHVDGGGTYAVTGVDTADWVYLNLHMRRVWAIEKDSLVAWYLPVDSIAGAAASFDFRPIFAHGGYLQAMGTWTLDAGAGVDDHAVFVSSEGEVAVYKGTDPSDAATWSLVGVWFVGKPIGRRCLVKFGGDLLMICKEGLLPFSKALMSSRVNTKTSLTDKIQPTVSEATSLYGDNFGWQILPYPQENMLILNVPVNTDKAHQYVMNTISGAWSRFTGWNARCWIEFNDAIYYGGADSVEKAWTGTADNSAGINGVARQAFSYFGSNALKVWKMVRPILRTDISPGLSIGVNVDFDDSTPAGAPLFTADYSSLWDVGLWDVATWSGSAGIVKDWHGIFGMGYCASLHLVSSSSVAQCTWASTDYLLEDGAVL